MKKSLIYVFTGDGKGKTTASLGILMRAAGHGMKTCFIQFMKEMPTGELESLEKLGVECISEGAGFYKIRGEHATSEMHKMKACKGLRIAKQKILSGDYDVVVLDEINVVFDTGILGKDDLDKCLEVLDERPKGGAHIVITGRGAPAELIARADLISTISATKHPFEKGIHAQKGLEF